jgi:hypothetical protein
MCSSFSGEDGVQRAKRLAIELRQRYKLKAYTYTKSFDHTDAIEGKAIIGHKLLKLPNGETALDENGQTILVEESMKPAGVAQFAETAVLVGDFDAIDDERAQKMLAKIKTIAPECLANGNPSELANDDALAGGKLQFYRDSISYAIDGKTGRLRNAFLLTNPMLPDEYFEANKIDKFVLNMNKKVRFSLLKCPGNYSVRVATFRGDTTINVREIQEKKDEFAFLKRNNRKVRSKLDICMNKANVLTKALRKEGIKAYEFHDREESYVCIGSFDWISRKDENGVVVEQNPEVRELILKYRGSVISQPGNPQVATRPKVLPSLRHLKEADSITFDIQPLPVVVPAAPQSVAQKFLGGKKWR